MIVIPMLLQTLTFGTIYTSVLGDDPGNAITFAAVLLAVAGVMAVLGKSQVKKAVPPVPEEAVASTKEDVRAVKESAHR